MSGKVDEALDLQAWSIYHWVSYVIQWISTSNHMFARAIWDKLPEVAFEYFEYAKNHEGDLFPKSPEPNVITG